jgi:hypothetical protein
MRTANQTDADCFARGHIRLELLGAYTGINPEAKRALLCAKNIGHLGVGLGSGIVSHCLYASVVVEGG